MKRLPDWQARLNRYIDSVRREPFEYGGLDCTLFAAGAVLAQTGVDLADGWRGRYTTHTGALRVLRKAGYRDHIELAKSHFETISKVFARAGDLAVIEAPDGPALGVVIGQHTAFLSPGGMVMTDTQSIKEALRV